MKPTRVELYAGGLAFVLVVLLAIWLLVYG
jgi:hypothetical protein